MKKTRFIALWLAAAVCWLGVAAGAAAASEQAVVIIDGGGVYNLYTGSALDALKGIDDEVGYLGHDTLMPNVTEYAPTVRTPNFDCLKDYDVSLWYFVGINAVNKVSAGELEYINANVKQGSVVGLGQGDDLLASIMNLQDPSNGIELAESESFAYFSYGLEDGVRDDFTLMLNSNASQGRGWRLILEWVEELSSGATASSYSSLASYVPDDAPLSEKYTASSDYDPWMATYNTKLTDYGQSGDIAMAISVYKLDTTSDEYDWYRVDSNTQASTWQYNSNWSSCEYYINSVDSKFKSYSTSTGELWEYSPTTTQTNTSVSYDLGVSLSGEVKKEPSAKGEISAGYSKSYDCYEVSIYDTSSLAMNKGEWSAEIEGTDWWNWWFGLGDYEPSATAQTSYVYEPSTIWRVAKDKPLELTTSAANNMESSYDYAVYVYYYNWVEAQIDNVELSVKGD